LRKGGGTDPRPAAASHRRWSADQAFLSLLAAHQARLRRKAATHFLLNTLRAW